MLLYIFRISVIEIQKFITVPFGWTVGWCSNSLLKAPDVIYAKPHNCANMLIKNTKVKSCEMSQCPNFHYPAHRFQSRIL